MTTVERQLRSKLCVAPMNNSKQKSVCESQGVNLETVIAKAKDGSEQPGAHQEQYPFSVKLETDQKCVKPTISVHGVDGDACVREAIRLLNQARMELGQSGFTAAPIKHEGNSL